ncbi:MAG: YggS family pyridoxal phosphate-dependent enzyme [Actinomycetales bacterium]|nr:YggS family pyridoxal phosphate-dependent enzyme [Actinomycetales bacterium]
MSSDRTEALRRSWQDVAEQVKASCRRHGRAPGDVTVIAVTKGFPASDVVALAGLGVTDVGESRDGEARLKKAQVEAAGLTALTWHAIGQVQTNKAVSVAHWADLVHAVDRLRLVAALASAGASRDVLIQVRAGGADHRGDGRAGAAPADVAEIAEAVEASGRLRLRGVMVVAEPGEPARPQFERVAEVWARLRAGRRDIDIFSAGMSGDFDDAIAAGATHLRIGTAILGGRQ